MTSSTTHRIAVVLAALVALAAFTGSALASTSKPSGMTKPSTGPSSSGARL
jgi:hypothetical protein